MNIPLTQLDYKFDEMVKATHTGQAHWAGTGPAGKTCRECIYWQANGHKADGMLKDARCEKYTTLSMRQGHPFSYEARACKYFEENDKPPPVMKFRKVKT